MTEQEKYQAKLREAHLIEEARLTYQRLAQGGFIMGGSISRNIINGTQTALVTFDSIDGYHKWFVASPEDGAFSEVFSFEVLTADYFIQSIFTVNLGGWMVCLEHGQTGERKVFFIAVDGAPIQMTEFGNNSFSLGHCNGKATYVFDYAGDTVFVFDGQEVHQYVGLMTGSTSAQIGTDQDISVAGGGVILKVVKEPQTGLEHHWYLLKNGVAELKQLDTPHSGTTAYWYAHHNSPRIAVIRRNNSTNKLVSWRVHDENGVILGQANVEADDTDTVDVVWYGPAGNLIIRIESAATTRIVTAHATGNPITATYPKEIGVTYDSNFLIYDTLTVNDSNKSNPVNDTFVWTRGVTNGVGLTGGLSDLSHIDIAYRIGTGAIKSFSLSTDLSPSVPVHIATVPRLVNDKIIFPVGLGGFWKAFVLDATSNTTAIVSPLDLEDRNLVVQNLEFPYLLQDPDENPISTAISPTQVSVGLLVQAWDAASNISTIHLVTGESVANPNYKIEQPNYNFQNDIVAIHCEAGPIVIWSTNLDAVLAFRPALGEWRTVYSLFGENGPILDSTRTRFNPLGKDGDQFLLRSNLEGGGDYLVNSDGIYSVSLPQATINFIRVGETGFYAGYYDADRDGLITINHYGRTGQLIASTETEYSSRSSREFVDSRALVELYNHATNEDLTALWIGGSTGGFVKDVEGGDLNANPNDHDWER